MRRLITASVIVLYVAFAPVCFSSMLESENHAMNHAQGHHQSHGGEKAGNCVRGDTCANDPLRALSEHIGMYEHVTSVGVSMSLTWLSNILIILALILSAVLRNGSLLVSYPRSHHSRSNSPNDYSAVLSALWGVWIWSRFHTNSPNLRFALA
jgi:hypothetical protein